MSNLRITLAKSTLRVTSTEPQPQVLKLRATLSGHVKVSEVGFQGPPGNTGPPGLDGEASIPPVIDGGNF